jgi:hypothetical protein
MAARVRRDVPVQARPRNDAYTGLLAISLGALITGCVLLYLDYSSYPQSKKPDVPKPTAVQPQAGGAGVGGR